jgi:hypothetical protein
VKESTQYDEKVQDRLCPKCQAARVYRSHRRGFFDRLQSCLGNYPHRCHACDSRFYSKAAKPKAEGGIRDPRPDLRKRRLKQLRRNILVCAICIATFLVFLYYLIQPRPE